MQVLLLDLDLALLRNPLQLFDTPAYRRTGLLLFRDRQKQFKVPAREDRVIPQP